MSITKEEGKAIAQAINGALGQALEKLTKGSLAGPTDATIAAAMPGKANGAVLGPKIEGPGTEYGNVGDRMDFEALYQKIKRRLIDECRVDPILLTLLTTTNAIEVQIEPRTMSLDGSTLKGRLMRLAVAGFFKTPKTQAETNRELGRIGTQAHTGRLSEAFADLRNAGFLTLEGDGFQIAPGLKVTETIIEAR